MDYKKRKEEKKNKRALVSVVATQKMENVGARRLFRCWISTGIGGAKED